MEKMKIAILGYGNLGRGVEFAVGQNDDMEVPFQKFVGLAERPAPEETVVSR